MLPTELTLAATARPPRASSASVAVWPDRQPGAVVLVDVGADLELAEVEHLGDRRAGLHLVADAVLVQGHAPEAEVDVQVVLHRRRRRPSTPSAPSATGSWSRPGSRAAPSSPSRARRRAPPRRTASARRDRPRAAPAGCAPPRASAAPCAPRAAARTSLAWTSSSAFRRSKRAVSRSRSSCACRAAVVASVRAISSCASRSTDRCSSTVCS